MDTADFSRRVIFEIFVGKCESQHRHAPAFIACEERCLRARKALLGPLHNPITRIINPFSHRVIEHRWRRRRCAFQLRSRCNRSRLTSRSSRQATSSPHEGLHTAVAVPSGEWREVRLCKIRWPWRCAAPMHPHASHALLRDDPVELGHALRIPPWAETSHHNQQCICPPFLSLGTQFNSPTHPSIQPPNHPTTDTWVLQPGHTCRRAFRPPHQLLESVLQGGVEHCREQEVQGAAGVGMLWGDLDGWNIHITGTSSCC